MNIADLRKPLSVDEIEFRVQSVNAWGKCTILAYKDARADMNRLDDVMGALNWKREHSNGNANCTVSLWNDDTKQWVSKEDTGSESMAEAKKGLASDSFKRACFNIGIGRELYDYPVIQIELKGDGKGADATKWTDEWKSTGQGKATATWALKLKEWKWHTIFNDAGKLVYLGGKDTNGVMRFTYDIRKKQEKKK